MTHLSPLRRLACALAVLGASLPVLAADLFVAPVPNQFAEAQPGVYSIRIDGAALANAIPGDRLRLNLPDNANYQVVLDRNQLGSSGAMTWIGHVAGYGNDYRVIFTVAPNGDAIGRMRLPGIVDRLDQYYRIEPTRVVSSFAAGEQRFLPDHADDRAAPPASAAKAFSLPKLTAVDHANALAAKTRVDLLVLYTQSLPGKYSGGLNALVDHLVAITNQAYIDSGVDMELYVVGKVPVAYSENTDNDPALDDLTNGSDIALTNVASWRQQYGADLVTLIRPFDQSVMQSCGVGWVNGTGGQALDSEQVYSIVSYGKSNGYYCDDYTLAHEVGHTMGAAHDRAHANSTGRYPYSYGNGLAGTFGTIMSYIDPVIGKFSNPKVTCNGYPCGNSELDPKNGANNALSFNNTKGTIAAFMPMAVDLSLTAITLAAPTIRAGAATTVVAVPSGAVLPSCSSSNTGVATVSGNLVTGIAAGSAVITCGSATATVTVQPALSFAVSGSQQTASNGNPKLVLSLIPDAADVGKLAQLYLAATTTVNGITTWYIHNGVGWEPYVGALPVYTNWTLSESLNNIVALNGELTAAELKGAQITVYLGYTQQGASISSLKYAAAYSFR